MSYIYVINQSDDPKTNIALYQLADEAPDMDVHTWMTANIPIGFKARLNIEPSYGIFISYSSPLGNILYESAVIPVTNAEGTFRVVRTDQEINLILTDPFSPDNNILVEIDKNVERLIRVNIIRNQLPYLSFSASPGTVRQFPLCNDLYINKVKSEQTQGSIMSERKTPYIIQADQTAVLTGTVNLGYDFSIRNTIYSDFITLIK